LHLDANTATVEAESPAADDLVALRPLAGPRATL
jgi:hypothetical protein